MNGLFLIWAHVHLLLFRRLKPDTLHDPRFSEPLAANPNPTPTRKP